MLRSLFCWLVALASAMGGLALALHHPLWPMGMLAMLCCAAVLESAVAGAWLLLLPACLPFLNFSPWTGWIAFEELDVLVLAMLAGGYARLALQRPQPDPRAAMQGQRGLLLTACLLALAVTGALAAWRGVQDAGGWVFDWFGAYDHAMNSLRVGKSLVYALALWPLLRMQLAHDPQRAQRLFAIGMMVGLAWVSLAVLWDRYTFVGIRDLASNYRTVATFWEMHVGGAAIDAYLAMATPFALLALVWARRPLAWVLASLLTLLTAYACLTTYSRGVYLALGLQLVLAIAEWLRHSTVLARLWARWRIRGTLVVAVLVVLEIVAVLGGNSFMNERIASAGQDMAHRLAHWRAGVALLDGWEPWLLGKGLGRLPANYAAQVPGEDFSGRISLGAQIVGDGSVNHYVRLQTPGNLDDLPGTLALTQRVDLMGSKVNIAQMRLRTEHPVSLTVLLCQRHLLYDRLCQGADVQVDTRLGEWQDVALPMAGPPLDGDGIPVTYALLLNTPGASVDITGLQVLGDLGQQLLVNGHFAAQMAHWFPSAQYYFLPWHIDNLYLEVLIERGLLGFLLLGVLVLWALLTFALGAQARGAAATAVVAALLGVLVVGLVSSVMDVPRVALLFYLLPLILIGRKLQR